MNRGQPCAEAGPALIGVLSLSARKKQTHFPSRA